MKAFFLDENNELAVVTRPTPTPKAGEVLVKVKAAALNHRDIWITKGLYPKIQLPTILGSDGAGTVTAIGSGVDEGWLNQAIISYPAYNWGDKLHTSSPEFRLIGMPDPGFIAEYITLPVENLLKKPEYLSWEQAAAIPVATLTAWRGLVTQGRVQAGDNVLITGIGGGVAQAGLALAVRHDANVYVTSSSPTKIAFARAHGAVEGFDYRAEGWERELKAISGGIDIILDGAAIKNFDIYMRFLNYGARIAAYGSTGSAQTTISVSRFFLKHIALLGTTMGSPTEFRDALAFMEEHAIAPVVHEIFPLEQALDAFNLLKEGNHVGKIVVSMG